MSCSGTYHEDLGQSLLLLAISVGKVYPDQVQFSVASRPRSLMAAARGPLSFFNTLYHSLEKVFCFPGSCGFYSRPHCLSQGPLEHISLKEGLTVLLACLSCSPVHQGLKRTRYGMTRGLPAPHSAVLSHPTGASTPWTSCVNSAAYSCRAILISEQTLIFSLPRNQR